MSFGIERTRGVPFEVGKQEPSRPRKGRGAPQRDRVPLTAEQIRQRSWTGSIGRLLPGALATLRRKPS
jgi:hypothetical protein